MRYTHTAEVYDLIYEGKDYAAEADELVRLVEGELGAGRRSLLDVACGSGRHLEHLARHFEVEGLDLTPELLEIARRRLPGVPLHLGDMMAFDLGRTFDVVTCLFSAVGYARDLAQLDRAVGRLAAHVTPGGLLVVEPWFTPEDWDVGRVHGVLQDAPDLMVARMNISQVEGRLSIMDMHFLIGSVAEGVRHFVERHEMGLFTVPEMTAALERAGLDVSFDPVGLIGRGLYRGRRPGPGLP